MIRNLLALGLGIGLLGIALAQQPPKAGPVPFKGPPLPPGKAAPVPPGKGPMAQKPKLPAKGPKIPDPEEVSLKTKDGVNLKATYYPPATTGGSKKETVPIIMVHGYEGQRGDFHGLAVHLQSLGHASLVPDLRGHGQSKLISLPNGTTGAIDLDKLKGAALEEAVLDLEACKKYLMTKNNEGELNIESLCVIGAEFGGILAVRWSRMDWSWPTLPSHKQGQDVKALVLLSPQASFKGVTMRDALAFPPLQTQVSYMLIAGSKDTKSAAEAKKLQKELQAHRPKLPEDSEDRLKFQDLFLIQPEGNLSGTKLLGKRLGIEEAIGKFIELRLANRKEEFTWQDRSGLAGK